MGRSIDHERVGAIILAALRRYGSVARALDEAGVSRSWASRRRRLDAGFDAAWRAAWDAGCQRLRSAASDPAARAALVPEGMVLTGSSGTATIRLQRERADRFTRAKRARFLAELRATCNVRAAARAVQVSSSGAYQAYHADAGLRAAWDVAIVEGRVHLEMAMMGAGRALFEPPEPPVEPVETPPVTGMDAKLALQLLQLHGSRRPKGSGIKPADVEATRREIMAKVAAIKAARAREGSGIRAGGASDGAEGL